MPDEPAPVRGPLETVERRSGTPEEPRHVREGDARLLAACEVRENRLEMKVPSLRHNNEL